MLPSIRTCNLVLALIVALSASVGCATTGPTNASHAVHRPAAAFRPVSVRQDHTRRGTELRYLLSPRYGVPRGLQFEDIIPVGARISAVNVIFDGEVKSFWLTYERGGRSYETAHRGGSEGHAQTFKLGSRENIVDMRAYGRPALKSIEIATNRRVVSLGAEVPSGTPPWYNDFTSQQMHQHVVVGVIGRADFSLRQLGVKIQVRSN